MTTKYTKKKTVLVVEDEKPIVEAIKIKFEKNGFVVVTAHTAQQAFNHLKNLGTVDAIWLDHYLLGKENGLDFAAKLKKHDGLWKTIPIFVISNTASSSNVKSYIQLGINKYYVKVEHRLDKIINEIKLFLDHLEK